MMKCKVACWFAVAAVWTCLATAQSSQSHLSSAQPPDPLKTVTKPLTEKSATPAQHKSSVAMPQQPAGKANTNAELSRLERQKIVLSNNPKSVAPGSHEKILPHRKLPTKQLRRRQVALRSITNIRSQPVEGSLIRPTLALPIPRRRASQRKIDYLSRDKSSQRAAVYFWFWTVDAGNEARSAARAWSRRTAGSVMEYSTRHQSARTPSFH